MVPHSTNISFENDLCTSQGKLSDQNVLHCFSRKNDDKDVTKINYNEPIDNLGMGGNITQSKSYIQIVDFSDFYFVLYNYSITSLLFCTLVTNLVYKN